MADHLGYEKGDPAGWGSGNNRNGSYPKTVQTDAGTVGVEMPRDRNATFEPQLISKHQRRLRGFNELVISLVARGMTTRDTRAHLQEIYGVEVSAELISQGHRRHCARTPCLAAAAAGCGVSDPLFGCDRGQSSVPIMWW